MRTENMTKADRYMEHDIRHILQDGYKDENPRPHYADGTPAHTISVNHVCRQYDLSASNGLENRY